MTPVRDEFEINRNGSSVTSLSETKLLAEIGRGLRSVYADVLCEPLPDRLAAAVRKLDAIDREAER